MIKKTIYLCVGIIHYLYPDKEVSFREMEKEQVPSLCEEVYSINIINKQNCLFTFPKLTRQC